MKEQLITFETAKLAKEKGFDEPCKWHYTQNNSSKPAQLFAVEYEPECLNTWNGRYSAPTQSLLQKWLREVHGIPIWIIPYSITNYSYHYFKKGGFTLTQENFKDYETSLESALYNGLKMI